MSTVFNADFVKTNKVDHITKETIKKPSLTVWSSVTISFIGGLTLMINFKVIHISLKEQ